MPNLADMPTYVRAIVSESEKSDCKRVQAKLGMTESQLVRAGLEKMGVTIEVEKAVGVPVGSVGNPSGKSGRKTLSDEQKAAIRADYQAGMSWKELVAKYGVSTRTISKAIEEK